MPEMSSCVCLHLKCGGEREVRARACLRLECSRRYPPLLHGVALICLLNSVGVIVFLLSLNSEDGRQNNDYNKTTRQQTADDY